MYLRSDPPPLQSCLPFNPIRGQKCSFFSLFYKYFFRTCTQTEVTIQKNGFNKNFFQCMLIAEYFYILSKKMWTFLAGGDIYLYWISVGNCKLKGSCIPNKLYVSNSYVNPLFLRTRM